MQFYLEGVGGLKNALDLYTSGHFVALSYHYLHFKLMKFTLKAKMLLAAWFKYL